MQGLPDFGAAKEVALARDALRQRFGRIRDIPRREPMAQLVKSMISGRTYDDVSYRSFTRLRRRYPDWHRLAAASEADIATVISDVTFPDIKARWLARALRDLGRMQSDYRLDFLAGWPVERALGWLEQFPGVGRKVSAATVNFSTLDMPAFVIDSHVARVLQRLGFVPRQTDTRAAYAAMMAAMADWPAEDLAEFHILMKRLGQYWCGSQSASCCECPLARACPSAH